MTNIKIPYDNMQKSKPSVRLYSKCCFCIPLRTGCLIVSYFNVIANLMLTVLTIYYGAVLVALTDGFNHTFPDIEYEVIRGSSPAFVKMEMMYYKMIGLLLTMLIALFVCWVVVSINCLIAVHKKNPKPIRTFTTFATARIFIHFVLGTYVLLQNGNYEVLVFQMLEFCFQTYYILIYHAYANRLEYEQRQKLVEIKETI